MVYILCRELDKLECIQVKLDKLECIQVKF
jgi:hypothetical protein